MRLTRVFALLLAAAVVAGVQDEAEISKWIADLLHADPARRAEVEQKLLDAGPKALPALKAAGDSKNADLAVKARAIAADIERIEQERKHDAEARPRRLEIVSLQAKDMPLGEALKALGKQVDSTLHTTVDAKQKLTLDVKDVPMRKCLDQIEDALKVTIVSRYTWHKVQAGAPARRKRAYVAGASFDFSLIPFKPEGQPPGWSLMIESTGPAAATVETIEVFDASNAKVEIARCGRCQARFALLKTDKNPPFKVKLKGSLVWESPYDLAVTDPAKPQDFKVGLASIHYEWPKADWKMSKPVAAPLIGRVELAAKLKKQFQNPGASGAMGVASKPPEPRPTQTWCACASGPSPSQPPQVPMLSNGSFFEAAFRTRKPEQLESLKVRFFKAIQEPFEVEASVAAD